MGWPFISTHGQINRCGVWARAAAMPTRTRQVVVREHAEE